MNGTKVGCRTVNSANRIYVILKNVKFCWVNFGTLTSRHAPMMLNLAFCLLSLSISVSTTTNAGLFDIAEYRRVSYEATIGSDLLWFIPGVDVTKVSASNIDALEQRILSKIPKETEPNYMFVTSKGGQKFACSLPNVDRLTVRVEPKNDKKEVIATRDRSPAAMFFVN